MRLRNILIILALILFVIIPITFALIVHFIITSSPLVNPTETTAINNSGTAEDTNKQLCDMRENTGTCYTGTTTSVNSTWMCNSTATKQFIRC